MMYLISICMLYVPHGNFFVSPPYMLWEQTDSPGTGTESSDSSPALLKAFFQNKGNDGTKAVLILPLFWGRERTLQTKDTEIFSDSWASLLHEKPFVLHLDPRETLVPGLGAGKAVQNTPARSHRDSKRQSSDFLLLLSSPTLSHPLGALMETGLTLCWIWPVLLRLSFPKILSV